MWAKAIHPYILQSLLFTVSGGQPCKHWHLDPSERPHSTLPTAASHPDPDTSPIWQHHRCHFCIPWHWEHLPAYPDAEMGNTTCTKRRDKSMRCIAPCFGCSTPTPFTPASLAHLTRQAPAACAPLEQVSHLRTTKQIQRHGSPVVMHWQPSIPTTGHGGHGGGPRPDEVHVAADDGTITGILKRGQGGVRSCGQP